MMYLNKDVAFAAHKKAQSEIDPWAGKQLPENPADAFASLIYQHITKTVNSDTAFITINDKTYNTSQELINFIIQRLNYHFSDDSNFKTFQTQLIQIYFLLASDDVIDSSIPFNPQADKPLLADKLLERLANCTPGFYTGIGQIGLSINSEYSILGLLQDMRTSLVDLTAMQLKGDVHAQNTVTIVANAEKYGTIPRNKDDPFPGSLMKNEIKTELRTVFTTRYTPLLMMQFIEDHLRTQFYKMGYKKPENDKDSVTTEFAEKSSEMLDKLFAKTAPKSYYFTTTTDEYDENIQYPSDLDWNHIRQSIFDALCEQQVFNSDIPSLEGLASNILTLTLHEQRYVMESNLINMSYLARSISNPYELAQPRKLANILKILPQESYPTLITVLSELGLLEKIIINGPDLYFILRELPEKNRLNLIKLIIDKGLFQKIARLHEYDRFDFKDFLKLFPEADHLRYLTELGTEFVKSIITNVEDIGLFLALFPKEERLTSFTTLGSAEAEFSKSIIKNMYQLSTFLSGFPKADSLMFLAALGGAEFATSIIKDVYQFKQFLRLFPPTDHLMCLTALGGAKFAKSIIKKDSDDFETFLQAFYGADRLTCCTALGGWEFVKTYIHNKRFTSFIRCILNQTPNYTWVIEDLLRYFDQRHTNGNEYHHSFWKINFGYSRTEKLDAVKALLLALVCKEPIDINQHRDVLCQGDLGKIVKTTGLLEQLAEINNTSKQVRRL